MSIEVIANVEIIARVWSYVEIIAKCRNYRLSLKLLRDLRVLRDLRDLWDLKILRTLKLLRALKFFASVEVEVEVIAKKLSEVVRSSCQK